MSNYSELLKHPKWQKMRLKILERDDFTCQICENTEKTLHVHHRFYWSGNKPWDYEESELVTLCEDCHKVESDNIQYESECIALSFRNRFFSDQIGMIWKVIKKSKFHENSEVICALLCAFFSDVKFQKKILKEFGKFYKK